MKSKALFLVLASVLSLSASTLTSCKNNEDDESYLPYYMRKEATDVIYAYTPKTEEITKEYYENVISKVDETYTWDNDRLSLGVLSHSTDGDTTSIIVNQPNNSTEVVAVRYMGVDTPELHHPSKGAEPRGLAAKQFIDMRFEQAKENGWKVVVEGGKFAIGESYDREAGYVWVGPHCLNIELLEIGLGQNKYSESGNVDNDPHKDWQPIARDERTLQNGYPLQPYGSKKWHYYNLVDPNWDASKSNGTNVETNPAVKDINYKYTFNFELAGKVSELPGCQNNPDLCITDLF